MGRQDTASDDVARGRPDPPPDAVRAQLSRVVGSPAFEHAPVRRRFLVHVVEGVLEGRTDQLKEYALGVDVFDVAGAALGVRKVAVQDEVLPGEIEPSVRARTWRRDEGWRLAFRCSGVPGIAHPR